MSVGPATRVILDPELEARLQRLATARRRGSDLLVRDAIQQYVEREERRDQFRREALAAWDEFRATGKHVTEEEADLWLARLEAGEDVEPPACHD